MNIAPHMLTGPADGRYLCYQFVRRIGFILDEVSYQGLEVWRDADQGRRRRDTDLVAAQGFWALGEAFLDALPARYPEMFAAEVPTEVG
jgi:hypothetical protein